MIDVKKVEAAVARHLQGGDMFLVSAAVSPANEVEVVIDGDSGVGIDACVELSRAVEDVLDRESEDFELTVSSAGIGQPLKMLRQYHRLIGGSVEVVLKNGNKITGELVAADEGGITVRYRERVATEENPKKKRMADIEKSFAMEDIKSTAEHLDFK